MSELRIPINWAPRAYQREAWDVLTTGTQRRAALVWHRRAGKDLFAINLIATQIFQRIGIYWHVLPTYRQGSKAVWNGKTRDGRSFLSHLPMETATRIRDDEMTVWFPNPFDPAQPGSMYQVIGADDPDRLVGSNPVGIVFSEWSIMPKKVWDLTRPILAENGGWAVFIFCVTGSTLVPTEDGLLRMDEIADGRDVGFSPYTRALQGLGGSHQASDFYRAGRQKTLRLRTAKGYQIECTPGHKLWTGDGWKRAEEWRVGDRLTLAVEGGLFGKETGWRGWTPRERAPTPGPRFNPVPFEPDEDFYYFLGLVTAEGWWNDRAVNIASGDPQIHEFLAKHGFHQTDPQHSVIGNSNLCSLLSWFEIGRGAHHKTIPQKIRRLPEQMLRSYLQGYFDGDGCATLRGSVHADSVSDELIRTLQVVLLQFGIVSSRRCSIVRPTKKAPRGGSRVWRVAIGGGFAARFFERIGFRLSRKQERYRFLSDRNRRQREDVVPIPQSVIAELATQTGGDIKRQVLRGTLAYCTLDRLRGRHPWVDQVTEDRFHWDRIVAIDEGEDEVFDFHIPETHSCVYNGINGHQTPRGKNHGWALYEDAKKSQHWFAQKLGVEDTHAVNEEDLAEEKRAMPRALYEQEYNCSFEAALEGSYYGEQIAFLRAQDPPQIGKVPWEPRVQVTTAWDLGMHDNTAIWFCQQVGKEVRLIDYYASSGVGLDHYAKVLHEKKYAYDRHLLPHDAEVRELGTGKSRVEVLRSLGIRATVGKRHDDADRINAVRMILPRCWFDEAKCDLGLRALNEYAKEVIEDDSGPNGETVYRDKPKHDWTSHGADSFGELAVGLRPPREKREILYPRLAIA